MNQAIILAGGKGTRLRARLGDLPKPLVDVCGVPLLERQIQLLKRYDFNQILILVGYQGERIVEFCHSRGNWGIDVKCIYDGVPLGTAGAVLNVFDYLDKEFLVVYGDTMLEIDIRRFCLYHAENKKAAATLFLHPNDHPFDSDLVDIDEEGFITAFYPYPHDPSIYFPNLVNAGLYLIRKDSLQDYLTRVGKILDFGNELFPDMISRGVNLRGYNSPEYIKDCGTPERLDKVIMDYDEGRINRASLFLKQKAVFLDRDGTINREVGHLAEIHELELLPDAAQAIRRLNQEEYRACLITNQPVVARGNCTLDGLRKIHNKLETLLGQERAFLDRIYYCPHHPDKGYPGEVSEFKIICGCRKPNTELVDRAMTDLNIARERSWMIGDSTTDILLANKTGLRSILVETGHAGLDHNYLVYPDFIVPNLMEAVSLILDRYPNWLNQFRSTVSIVQPGDVILIGGNSRSGKSTFASVVRDLLLERGIKGRVLTTDRWLLSEGDRGPGVLQRHDLNKLRSLFAKIYDPIKRPKQINLPFYKKGPREHVPNAEVVSLSPQDVLIFEGVVALCLETNKEREHRFYVEIDEKERKKRIISEYCIRGFSSELAELTYFNRMQEEVPLVQDFAAGDNIIHIHI